MILGSALLEMDPIGPMETRKPEARTNTSHRLHDAPLNTQADAKKRMVKLQNV
jgi:hypothetical protein